MSGLGWLYSMVESSVLTTAESNQIDEKTFETKVQWGEKIGRGMGDFHPIAWYQNYDGGRSFYTAMGHLPAVFNDEKFKTHLYGGIYWAATGKGIQP